MERSFENYNVSVADYFHAEEHKAADFATAVQEIQVGECYLVVFAGYVSVPSGTPPVDLSSMSVGDLISLRYVYILGLTQDGVKCLIVDIEGSVVLGENSRPTDSYTKIGWHIESYGSFVEAFIFEIPAPIYFVTAKTGEAMNILPYFTGKSIRDITDELDNASINVRKSGTDTANPDLDVSIYTGTNADVASQFSINTPEPEEPENNDESEDPEEPKDTGDQR